MNELGLISIKLFLLGDYWRLKQCLSLAAALIHDPKLLLLFPTAGVDPKRVNFGIIFRADHKRIHH